jgi:pSer/pThr/pTyr-binding forkhead associated (FHA) protein
VEDLGSKNGTFHKERRIERPAALSDGDEIRLGSLRFEIPRCAARHPPRRPRR